MQTTSDATVSKFLRGILGQSNTGRALPVFPKNNMGPDETREFQQQHLSHLQSDTKS